MSDFEVRSTPKRVLETRQSEMANTSSRHMPVLGYVHPIKIEKFHIFSWRDVPCQTFSDPLGPFFYQNMDK